MHFLQMHLEALDLDVLLIKLLLDFNHLGRKVCLDGVELLRQRLIVRLGLAEVDSRALKRLHILVQVFLPFRLLSLQQFYLLLESGHFDAGLRMRLLLLLEQRGCLFAVFLVRLKVMLQAGDDFICLRLFSLGRVEFILKLQLLAQDHSGILFAGGKLLLKVGDLVFVLLLTVRTGLIFQLELIN